MDLDFSFIDTMEGGVGDILIFLKKSSDFLDHPDSLGYFHDISIESITILGSSSSKANITMLVSPQRDNTMVIEYVIQSCMARLISQCTAGPHPSFINNILWFSAAYKRTIDKLSTSPFLKISVQRKKEVYQKLPFKSKPDLRTDVQGPDFS